MKAKKKVKTDKNKRWARERSKRNKEREKKV